MWGGGLIALLLIPRHRLLRPVAIAYLLILTLLVVQGAKPYYLAAAYTVLFAAGGLVLEGWTQRGAQRAPMASAIRVGALLLVLAGGVICAPRAKAILPVEIFLAYQDRLGIAPVEAENHEMGRLPQFFADMYGWRELADAVAEIHAALPDGERGVARIFGSNYGQAGAIDLFGPELGLPPAISGHNGYHTWGPGDFDGSLLIVIGARREQVEALFEEVVRLEFEHPDAMPYEGHKSIWIARRLRCSIEEFWAAVKSFG